MPICAQTENTFVGKMTLLGNISPYHSKFKVVNRNRNIHKVITAIPQIMSQLCVDGKGGNGPDAMKKTQKITECMWETT